MALFVAYHRPGSLQEALELLRSPQRVALAGGTKLNADREPCDLEAVDLQALDLRAVDVLDDGRVRLGATATLDDLQRCELLADSLRALARAEQPSTLRTLATVGGLVADAPSESLLLAALLAHHASVQLAGPNGAARADTPLHRLLATGVAKGALITSVTIDVAGETAYMGTARTPADVPIVGVYARRACAGRVWMAISGVADHPVTADASQPTAHLDPPSDFRGSSAYRLHLARILSGRVMRMLGTQSTEPSP